MALSRLRIFISSPGDVAEERLIARRVIGRLDAQLGSLVRLEAVFWEHQPLSATRSFQEQLLRPSQTDIVLVILWSRLGTLLPGYMRRPDGSPFQSGTEYEFEDAMEGYRRQGKPEVVAYRKTQAVTPPSDPALLDDFVRQRQGLERFVTQWFHNTEDGSLKAAFHPFASSADFEEMLESHLLRLVEQRLPPGAATGLHAATWREGSPFRGLQAFESQHAPVFFGRTAAVASVLARLRAQAERRRAFVLVVGMSGGGKSSLVRAGVLPLALQPGVLGTATAWRQAIMRPSDGLGDLGLALAQALTQALPDSSVSPTASNPGAEWAADPAAAAAHVVQGLDAAGTPGVSGGSGCHLLLLVDQLEEMYSDPRITAADRAAFVATLQALVGTQRVWILATLRSDVYPRLAELPQLMALKEGDGQYDLLPPTLREIGQIIRLPATASGLRFEVRANTAERLDETIRDAAARNPGALPLLQFLLEELYRRRSSDDVLTFRAYEELGGVEGALAQRAEAVLAEVSEAARATLQPVLRELVTFATDDESKVLRRIAPRDAFQTASANELVDALLQARLLVSALDDQGQSTVALAHEALLEFWPRLRQWRDADRELLHVHARVAAAARVWERQGRASEFLLARGKPLAEARQLLNSGMRLSPLETTLIQVSERRGRQFVRLRASAVAGLAVLSVVASIAAYRATVESDRARVQATTAQRTTDFMVSLFAIADPDENRGQTVTVREVLDRGVTEIQSGLGEEQAVRSNLLRAMGQAYNGLGLYPKAHGVLKDALAEAERSGIAADILKARLALAANRYVDDDCKEAEPLFRRAMSEAQALYGEQHATLSEASVGVADCMSEQGQVGDAEALYRRALAIDLALHGEQHPDTARSLNSLASSLYGQARHAEAEALFRRALSIRQALYGDRHASVAVTLNNLGALHFETGQYARATGVWTDALRVSRAVYGPEHLVVAAVLNNLGRVALMQGGLEESQRRFDEALAMDRRLLAAEHEDLVVPINSLAMIALAKGDRAAATALLGEALGIARERHHWMLAQVLGNRAELQVSLGQVGPARASLAEARAALQQQYGDKLLASEAWRAAVLDGVEAACDVREGRHAQAEVLLLAALPRLQQRFGPHGYYPDRLLRLGIELYASWGNAAEAARWRNRLVG